MTYRVRYQKDSFTFSPEEMRARVLMFPFATSAELMEQVLDLGENQHHAWGVKKLLSSSIEVTVIRWHSSKWDWLGQAGFCLIRVSTT